MTNTEKRPRPEVAAAAALEHRHARAALADFAARLGARRDTDHVRCAVGTRNLDLAAQRRIHEAHRHLREQGRAVPLPDRVGLHVDEDVEVAGLAATLLPGLEDLARPETVLPAGKRA